MNDNECLKVIRSRRSVRRFSGELVKSEWVEEILKSAMAAPSAGNQQPWHFVVIEDRATLDSIPTFHPHAKMLHEAPLGILVCGDLSLEKHQGYWVQDCSAATENLLLAAHSLGLGAVWLGVHPNLERSEGFKRLLGLPASVVPLSMIALGHPTEAPQTANRFSWERVHRNRW